MDQNEGLTELGKQLVCDCGEKGILVDVSHLSDRGFWDVCEATDRPFVATHSDSRVLCRNSRNLTDEPVSYTHLLALVPEAVIVV